MRNKKKNRIYFLLILLLGISIGFAALATTLKINGTANIAKNTWDVHWANVGDIQKSSTTTITTGATVDSNDNTKVNFEVTLNQPGDYYEFQVDAVNAGTIDAMANIVSQTTVPSYASLTVKYADGEEISKYDLLAKAPDPTADPPVYTTERVKVRIEFLSDIDPEDLDDIGDDESIDIEIDVPYDQADDNAKDRHYEPTCPGKDCVYAVYTEPKYFTGNNRSTLTTGTDDYRNLKDPNNKQRDVFIGHILDENNKIEKAYICGIYNGTELYCLQADYDGSYYASNKDYLLSTFGTNPTMVNTDWGPSYFNGCRTNNDGGVLCDKSSENSLNAAKRIDISLLGIGSVDIVGTEYDECHSTVIGDTTSVFTAGTIYCTISD